MTAWKGGITSRILLIVEVPQAHQSRFVPRQARQHVLPNFFRGAGYRPDAHLIHRSVKPYATIGIHRFARSRPGIPLAEEDSAVG